MTSPRPSANVLADDGANVFNVLEALEEAVVPPAAQPKATLAVKTIGADAPASPTKDLRECKFAPKPAQTTPVAAAEPQPTTQAKRSEAPP